MNFENFLDIEIINNYVLLGYYYKLYVDESSVFIAYKTHKSSGGKIIDDVKFHPIEEKIAVSVIKDDLSRAASVIETILPELKLLEKDFMKVAYRTNRHLQLNHAEASEANNELSTFLRFIENFKPVLLSARKMISSIKKGNDKFKAAETICKLATDVSNWISTASQYVDKMPSEDEETEAKFKEICKIYLSRDFDIDEIKNFITEEENKKMEKVETYKSTPIKFTDPEPDERTIAIDKANEKYDMFCKDFLRDLEKQYAFSSYDLYKKFIDVKFKKFTENSKMPLDKNASLGKAKQAIAQIDKMIDEIIEISEASYSINKFGE